MKVRDALKMLHADGWEEIARRGSHRQLKRPLKKGRVIVPGKPSDDLAARTLNSILKQAGPKEGPAYAICRCNRIGWKQLFGLCA